MTESLCCAAAIGTTLEANYGNNNNKKNTLKLQSLTRSPFSRNPVFHSHSSFGAATASVSAKLCRPARLRTLWIVIRAFWVPIHVDPELFPPMSSAGFHPAAREMAFLACLLAFFLNE